MADSTGHKLMRNCILALAMTVFASIALAQERDKSGRFQPNSGFEEAPVWKEETDIAFPAFPIAEDLREFFVSGSATHVSLIDPTSLTVGTDHIIRYVLVVRASGGAMNTSFEGINCGDRTWKLYATGRADGSWSRAQGPSAWRPIDNLSVNRQRAALSKDMFCPRGRPIATADEGRNAIRLGGHPEAR